MRAPLLALIAVLIPQICRAQACGSSRLAIDSIHAGPIRIGMPVDSVKLMCRGVRDTFDFPEGQRQRALYIPVLGGDLRVWIVSDVVYNILVTTPTFVASDSTHVGSPLSRLLHYPDLRGGSGEGAFFVMTNAPALCGLSFELDISKFDQRIVFGPDTTGRLKRLATAPIRSILVRRCFKGH